MDWRIFWLGCCVNAATVNLFFSNQYLPSPGLVPDNVCRTAGESSSLPSLGLGKVYRAVAMTASTQDLSSIFPAATEIWDASPSPRFLAADKTSLFSVLGSSYPFANMSDANGSMIPANALFWTGSSDMGGTTATMNCGDYTIRAGNGRVGMLGRGFAYTTSGCGSSNRFLCATNANALPDLTGVNPLASVYLFPTNKSYVPVPGLDPDILCQTEGMNSNHPRLGAGLQYQALAFTARRLSLPAIFPSNYVIRDLDDHVLAADVTSLFRSVMTRRALLNAASTSKLDVSSSIWTGAYDDTGLNPGRTCGDWTGGTSGNAYWGTLEGGLQVSWDACYSSYYFLCAANVQPLAPPPTFNATSVYLFPTNASYAANRLDLDPDAICQSEGAASSDMRLGPNITYQALVITSRRQELQSMFPSGYFIRDLSDNVLAMNVTSLFGSALTRKSMPFPLRPTKLDTNTPFWTGVYDDTGLNPGRTCGDWTGGTSGNAYWGTLEGGLQVSWDACYSSYYFLCAANVQPLAPPVPIQAQIMYLFPNDIPLSGLSGASMNQTCWTTGSSSRNPRLGPSLSYRALAFLPTQRNVSAGIPQDLPVYDLDDNLIARNASRFFALGTRMALQDANCRTKLDIDSPFWTGVADRFGTVPSSSCQNWTSTGLGAVGSLQYGLAWTTSNCNNVNYVLCLGITPAPVTVPQPLCRNTLSSAPTTRPTAAPGAQPTSAQPTSPTQPSSLAPTLTPGTTAPASSAPTLSPVQRLCNLFNLSDPRVSIESCGAGSNPTPAPSIPSIKDDLSDLTVILSPIIDIVTNATNGTLGDEPLIFTIPFNQELRMVTEQQIQEQSGCLEPVIRCEWQDPHTLEWSDSGCQLAHDYVPLSQGGRGATCNCSHLTIFSLVMRAKLNRAPLCAGAPIDYALIALYAVVLVVALIQLIRLMSSCKRWGKTAKAGRNLVLQHTPIALAAVLRIAFAAQKGSMDSSPANVAGLVALGMLPTVMLLILFMYLITTWASIQLFSMTQNPFEKLRIPFALLIGLIVAIFVGVVASIAALEAEHSDTIALAGSYAMAAITGLQFILICWFGLGLVRLLSKTKTNSTKATNSGRRLLAAVLLLSLSLFVEAAIWVAAVDSGVLASTTATLAVSAAFSFFDLLTMATILGLLWSGVRHMMGLALVDTIAHDSSRGSSRMSSTRKLRHQSSRVEMGAPPSYVDSDRPPDYI